MTIDLIALIEEARSIRPLSKKQYVGVIRKWYEFAGTDPDGWTPAVCQDFYSSLLKEVSVKTANSMVTGGLAFAFKRANAIHGIPNPTLGLDRVHPTRDVDRDATPSALEPAQARALLAACEGPSLNAQRDRAIVLIGLYTGLRRSSLVSINLEDVQVHKTHVTLKVTLKGGDIYRVPLDARVWEMLQGYRKLITKHRGKEGPLFTSLPRPKPAPGYPLGKPVIGPRLDVGSINDEIGKRAIAAGIDTFHPHILRHTFVSWCQLADISEPFIRTVTGHKASSNNQFSNTPASGLTHYTDAKMLAPEAARRCFEAIHARLEEIP